MDFLHLKASENLKISVEISNMKFDIIVRPFLCPVPLQKVFRFEFLKSHGTQNWLKDCSTSVWKSQPSVNHSVHTIARWIISQLVDDLIFIDLSCLTWIRVVWRRPGLSHESMKVENSWYELQETSNIIEIGPIALKCGPKTYIQANLHIFSVFRFSSKYDHHLMSDSELL